MDSLELYEADALLRELARRCTAMLVVRLVPLSNSDQAKNKLNDVELYFDGGAVPALGMVRVAEDYLLNLIRSDAPDARPG